MRNDTVLFISTSYEKLNLYGTLLNTYYLNLYDSNFGLNINDYKKINKIIKKLLNMRSTFQHYFRLNTINHYNPINRNIFINLLNSIDYLITKYTELQKTLKSYIMPRKLKDVIHEEYFLTHLVFTNNKHPKIKLYSDDSFLFLCLFHSENTPSLCIMNKINIGRCFGCGALFNNIQYIMKYENLNYHEAISLLAKIYMIDLPQNIYDDNNPLVIKYRNLLISKDFKNLLIRAYERTQKKGETLKIKVALEQYDYIINTIDRIKNNEYLKPHLSKKPLCKVLVLDNSTKKTIKNL